MASLGRAARSKASIKVRQPLAKALVLVPDEAECVAVAALREHIQDELNVKDVQVVQQLPDLQGTSVSAGDERYAVVVLTDLSDELVAEGFARELVRRLQTMRRSANLEISDHILVSYEGSPALQKAFERFAGYITQETLALELRHETPSEGMQVQTLKLDGNELVIGLTRAG